MLYVNGKVLDTLNDNDGYEFANIVKDYHETIKKNVEYFGNLIHIETKIRPYRDGAGTMRFPGPRGLLKRSNVSYPRKDGGQATVELMYSPVILQEENGRLKLEDPNILITKGELSIDVQRNPDLAYYVFKCGKIGSTPAEGKKFYIRDVKKMHDNNAERRKLEGSVLNLIYSALPEDKLRLLAKSFGVGGVNLKSINVVRDELYELLERGEELKKKPGTRARGFKEFIDSSEVKFHDQVAALCRDAEEKGKLIFDAVDRRWIIDYQDGGTPYILKEMAGDEFGDPLGSLVNFLLSDSDKRRKVENVMGIGTLQEDDRRPEKDELGSAPTETEKPEITAEMILKTTNVPKLKSWLKQFDPEAKIERNWTGQEIKQRLLPHVTPKPPVEVED